MQLNVLDDLAEAMKALDGKNGGERGDLLWLIIMSWSNVSQFQEEK